MTIAFPRELPADIEWRVLRFEPVHAVAAARSGNRVMNASQIADPFWLLDIETTPQRYAGLMRAEAWVASLRGGLRRALYRHQLSSFPAAHPGDGGVAVTPGTLTSVANGNEVTFTGVDAGLVLTVGDLVGIEATHRCLGIVTEVAGAGGTRTIAIEPPPPDDVAIPGAVVRFVRPGLIMRYVPGSKSVQEVSAGGLWTLRFSLQESR